MPDLVILASNLIFIEIIPLTLIITEQVMYVYSTSRFSHSKSFPIVELKCIRPNCIENLIKHYLLLQWNEWFCTGVSHWFMRTLINSLRLDEKTGKEFSARIHFFYTNF